MFERGEVREPSPRLYYLSAALTAIAIGASNAFVPLYLKGLGLSYVVAGIPLVIRAMGRFSFDVASIYIIGLVRPGVMLCSGIAVAALGVLICGLFPFAIAVDGAYLLIGVGMAAFHVPLRQIVFEMSKKGGRGRAIGTLSVFIAIGSAVGIVLGGLISDLAGYRNLFFTDLSTFRGAFRGVRRESGLLTGFFGKGKLREGVLIMQENKQHTT